MNSPEQNGYTSVGVLILVLFLSLISLSVLAYLRIFGMQYNRVEKSYEEEARLEEAIWALLAELSEDPTPESDSPFDPVWGWLDKRDDQSVPLKLEDISSRFNLNFMRTKMLEESAFRSMMINGKSPQDLKLHRGEEGFSEDLIEGYGEFFEEEVLKRYFTVHSYANLNVTYEDSLKKIYEIRVSESGSHAFLSSVQQLIGEKVMADGKRMAAMLGTGWDSLYPLINIEPLININFAEEKILEAVLRYPYGEEVHEKSDDFREIILAERSTMEILPQRLNSILAVEGDYKRIGEYLGTVTWFWKITAGAETGGKLEAIICRLPGDGGEWKFSILQWKLKS